MSIDNLLLSLEKIISELNKSGKIQSRSFFISHYDAIKASARGIPQDAIRELSTCRAMAQYADFTYKEEELLNSVVNNAIALIKSNP
nr:hypothetical protein [Erwinia sp. Ejp617]